MGLVDLVWISVDFCGFRARGMSPPPNPQPQNVTFYLVSAPSKRKLGVVDLVWISMDFDLWFWAEKFHSALDLFNPGPNGTSTPLVLGPKRPSPVGVGAQQNQSTLVLDPQNPPTPCFWAHIVHPPWFWAQHVHPPLGFGPKQCISPLSSSIRRLYCWFLCHGFH